MARYGSHLSKSNCRCPKNNSFPPCLLKQAITNCRYTPTRRRKCKALYSLCETYLLKIFTSSGYFPRKNRPLERKAERSNEFRIAISMTPLKFTHRAPFVQGYNALFEEPISNDRYETRLCSKYKDIGNDQSCILCM